MLKRAIFTLLLFVAITIGQQTSLVKTIAAVTMTGSAQIITPGVPTYGHWVVFDCPTANQADIALGDANVSVSGGRGATCRPGGYAFWPASGPVYNLAEHYAIGTSGDKVKISYQAY